MLAVVIGYSHKLKKLVIADIFLGERLYFDKFS